MGGADRSLTKTDHVTPQVGAKRSKMGAGETALQSGGQISCDQAPTTSSWSLATAKATSRGWRVACQTPCPAFGGGACSWSLTIRRTIPSRLYASTCRWLQSPR